MTPADDTPRASVADGRRTVRRVAVAVGVAAVFGFLTWADGSGLGGVPAARWLLPVALAVAVGGADEIRRLAAGSHAPLPAAIVLPGCLMVPLAAAWGAGVLPVIALPGDPPDVAAVAWGTAAALGALAVAAIRELILFRAPGGGAAARLATMALVVVWLGLPLACLVGVRVHRGAAVAAPGIMPLASLVAVVKVGDAVAYVVGSIVGRRRMAPALSPGKTWEGTAASLLGSLLTALAFFGPWTPSAPWGGWLLYGMAVGGAGIVGDLVESLLKREAGQKDSGRSLGPLGGVLDLVDSLLLAAPVAWALWAASR